MERGRRGPNALRDIRPYVKRDTRDLWPTDIYIGDGHTFDAEIAHPGHGNPFRPEVTSVLDVATRKCVGWSVELSENRWAVADAIRMATSTHGVAAIYYSDRGPGERNAHLDDAATGLLGRIGTSHEFSIARRSQARGVIEAFHRHLTALAKSSPTYMGEAMDKDARQAVYKLTRADLKRNGSARLLPPWRDFVAALAAAIDQYNTRPHSSLPKILDPATGQRRHQTPSEAWEAAVARGFEPVTLPAAEIEDLFRPHEIRRCRRGLVSLWGGEYFARALEHYHGDRVAVGYDIHDPAKVWIRDLEGRLIATAELAGHARPYMPASRIEVARKIRGQAQIKRLDAQRACVAADLGTGPALIEHAPAVELTPEQLAEADAAFARLEACGGADGGAVANDDTPPLDAAGSAARPVFGDDLAFVRWVAEHPQAATAADTTLLRGLLRGKSFRRLLEFEGVDLAALETIAC